MEENVQGIHLSRLHARLGEIVYQLTEVRLLPPHTWRPALNAYLCKGQIVVCLDLAGVEKDRLELQVEPRRLSIHGHRAAPEPGVAEQKALQLLAMEIDYGPFGRELDLPVEVEPERVTARQANGLLWVYLPLRSPA